MLDPIHRRWLLLGGLPLALAGCSSRDAIPNYDADASVGASECSGKADGEECGPSQICIAQECRSPACGDGVRSDDEECDDGNQTDDDGCNNECVSSICGNGYVDPYEDCDDFNTQDGDRCPSNCREPEPYCGDRVINGDEVCDGPQVGVTGISQSYSCSNDCTQQVAYACELCQDARCRAYKGRGDMVRNAVQGCLEVIPEGATPASGVFLERCAALVNCALRNRCGIDGNSASLSCFCGATEDKACAESGPAQEGACHAEFAEAADSDDGATIVTRMSDFAHPVAWASALLDCYRDQCLGPVKKLDDEGMELVPAVFLESDAGVATTCFPL